MPDSNASRTFNPIVVALLVFGVALIGYEIYRDRVQRDAEAKQAAHLENIAQQTAALKQEAGKLREEAANLGEQTEKMKQQVQEQHRAAEEERRHFITAANLAEGIQAASLAKTAIAEFYLTEGRFPSTNTEIGMQAPEKYAGRSLRSMKLSENGIIVLTYDDKSGVEGTIRLVPDDSNQRGSVKWRCITPSYSNIATILPNCEYTQARR